MWSGSAALCKWLWCSYWNTFLVQSMKVIWFASQEIHSATHERGSHILRLLIRLCLFPVKKWWLRPTTANIVAGCDSLVVFNQEWGNHSLIQNVDAAHHLKSLNRQCELYIPPSIAQLLTMNSPGTQSGMHGRPAQKPQNITLERLLVFLWR
jgi:hypothetical protein